MAATDIVIACELLLAVGLFAIGIALRATANIPNDRDRAYLPLLAATVVLGVAFLTLLGAWASRLAFGT